MAARRGSQWTAEFERNVRKLERQLPAPVRRMLRQLGKNLHDAQRQAEAARAQGEVRLRRLQKQLRGDATRVQKQLRGDATQLVRQLRQAVEPKTSRARPAAGRARRSRKK
jgi:hypothetical protein